jgi:hypothetical protein
VRVLLGFSEPEVLHRVSLQDVGEASRERLRFERDRQVQRGVVAREAGIGHLRRVAALELGKVGEGDRPRDLPYPVGPEVETDHRVAAPDRSEWRAVAGDDGRLDEFVGGAGRIGFFQPRAWRGDGLSAPMHDGVVRALRAVPSTIPIHRVVASADARDLPKARGRERSFERRHVAGLLPLATCHGRR